VTHEAHEGDQIVANSQRFDGEGATEVVHLWIGDARQGGAAAQHVAQSGAAEACAGGERPQGEIFVQVGAVSQVADELAA